LEVEKLFSKLYKG